MTYLEQAFEPAEGFPAHPARTLLSDHGVFAYLLEFMTFAIEAGLVAQATGTEFDLPSQEAFEHSDGHRLGKAIHFSIQPEFAGAVVVLATNSIALLAEIDALKMEPPPPWHVFPDDAPSTPGSCEARSIIGGPAVTRFLALHRRAIPNAVSDKHLASRD